MDPIFKKILPHLGVIAALLAITVLFFSPQLEGKYFKQKDIIQYQGMTGEIDEFKEKTGKTYYWTNGMFVGMPWGLLVYSRKLNLNHNFIDVFQLGIRRPIGYVLAAMLTTYLVLFLLGVNPWLSALGAFAIGFTTHQFVLFDAGHNSKIEVLSYLPLVFGSLLLAIRKKFISAAILMALGTSLAIYAKHIQMVYYLALAAGLFFLVYAIMEYRKIGVGSLAKIVGVLAIAGLLGIGANMGQILSSRTFAEDTIRGKAILEKDAKAVRTGDVATGDGLSWDYVNEFSNGFLDLFTIMIPRVVGGSSAEAMSPASAIGKAIRKGTVNTDSKGNYLLPMYWGGLPLTSGPFYMGALVILLFCFSMFTLQPAYRWGTLAAVLLLLIISMGKNMEIFNRLMFDYFPMFKKFRTPNSAMSILPIIMIIPAFFGLQKVFKTKDKKPFVKSLLISLGITGGICLILGLIGPGIFDFTHRGDGKFPETVQKALIEGRAEALRSSAFRSLAIILIGGGILFIHFKGILKSSALVFASLGLIMLIDLWTVGKRYINEDNFVEKSEYFEEFETRTVDEKIKMNEPKGRGYYRVLDLSIKTFQSASTSKHHNTVGGYYAAKLRRFEDVFDRYLNKGNREVINMFNTKYVINKDEKVTINDKALGNAWLVEKVRYVNTPNEEFNALEDFDPATEAIVLKDEFAEAMEGYTPGKPQGKIKLKSYEPDHLVYEGILSKGGLAVFSETWYGPDKGWEATINGEPAEIIRVNYMLRALRVPKGSLEIVFTFNPKVGALPRTLSWGSSILITLGVVGALFWALYQYLTKSKPAIVAETSTTTANESSKSRAGKKKKRKSRSKGKKK